MYEERWRIRSDPVFAMLLYLPNIYKYLFFIFLNTGTLHYITVPLNATRYTKYVLQYTVICSANSPEN